MVRLTQIVVLQQSGGTLPHQEYLAWEERCFYDSDPGVSAGK